MIATTILLFGINKIYICKEKKKQILYLKEMFKVLKDLIGNNGTVLKEAFDIICSRENLKDFQTAQILRKKLSENFSFEKSIMELVKIQNEFDENIKEILVTVAPLVGTSEIKTQIDSIDYAINNLEKLYEIYSNKIKEEIPLIKVLTLCGFFGTIIILI